ncbi:alpha/beta fold hydrolase [Nocardia miyunensis]|uniref:alpha/beta fold hydrolase n=1 Tax=Nocardia miyunensis TaxID=282684 RepID=UPI000832033B|nr:alpha/beta hydrolase [Nocardia miyunensis]
MRGYVDTRWGQLHYSSTGAGNRTIVLFHETPLSHGAYQRLAPELAESFRVIVFDTPGYGESDPPQGITTIEEYAATFLEGIDALGVDRFTVLGAHTGADFAVELAANGAHDRVDGVVLIGVPFYEEQVRRARVPAVVPAFRDDGQHLLESFNRPPKIYDAELLSRMAGSVCEFPDRAFWAYHSVYAYLPGEALPKISAPVLFLSHEQDPLYDGDCMGLKIVSDGRQVMVPSERLPLYWTQPARVAEQVRSLLGEG